MKTFFYFIIVILLCSCGTTQNATTTNSTTNTVNAIITNDSDDINKSKDYSVLSQNISNDYRYINENLFFVYDEKYNSNLLSYKILSKKGVVSFSNNNKPIPIKYGRNYIALKFPKSTYRNWDKLNPLLLEVNNSKNQKKYL